MRAAQLVEPKSFKIVEVPDPKPRRGELLLKVAACGVCTGDFYAWSGNGRNYPMMAGAPGHEVCGSVVEIGESDEGRIGIELGQAVTAITFPGSGYAEYVVAPASQVVTLPSEYRERIVLGEPLACAMNAMRRSGVLPGDSVLVIGAGFMGILALTMLKNMGATPIVVADVLESGRAWAKKYGADVVLDPQSQEFGSAVKELTEGRGFDVVVEAAGVQSALDLIADAVRIRGTVVVYGYHLGGDRSVNMQLWNWKGLTVVNGHERDNAVYAHGMQKALQMLRYLRFAFDFVSHRFPLEEINEAFSVIEERPRDYLKAAIELT